MFDRLRRTWSRLTSWMTKAMYCGGTDGVAGEPIYCETYRLRGMCEHQVDWRSFERQRQSWHDQYLKGEM